MHCRSPLLVQLLILVCAGDIVFFFTGYTKYHTLRPIGRTYLFQFSIVKLLECVKKIMHGKHLSLCMVITGNNVHSIHSSFAGKHKVILCITDFYLLFMY